MRSIVLAVVVGFLASGMWAQPIERAAQWGFETGFFHGAVVLSDGTELVYRGGFGDADREDGLPNDPELRFPIQSISKSFTAILVLQLVAEDRIALDDTLADWLPFFESEASDKITIHHLLCHQSGLPDYFLSIRGYLEREPPDLSREQAMARVAEMEIQFEPGSAFNYSNTNYVLLGMILERETKLGFAELVEERLFSPLGMDSSGTVKRSERIEPLCFYTDAGETETIPDVFFLGGSGIVSTLDDLVAFGHALGSPELLDADMWALAFTEHSSPEDAHNLERGANLMPYGYGFQIMQMPIRGRDRPVRLVGHLGLGYGSSCLLLKDADGERVLAYWNNIDLSPFNPVMIEAAFIE